jgi:hypothetical protein
MPLCLPTDMPRGRPFSVLAKDDWIGVRYRITPSKETRLKFKDVGKIPRQEKPAYPRPRNFSSPEETLELQQQGLEHFKNLSLLARLNMEKKALEERLAHPPIPLIDRISAPLELPTYTPPPPIPSKMHFHKTKILLRIKEHRQMFDPVIDRLNPLFDKLQNDENLGDAARVPKETRESLWEWYNKLYDLYYNFEERSHKLENKEWRQLKGVLKKVGKVSFEKLDSRLVEVCAELQALNLTSP